MMEPKSPPAAKVAAAKELMDRGWGRAAQIIEGNPDQPLTLQITIIDPTKPE